MNELEPEVVKLLHEGRKIEAIKRLREIRKIGLKEAKEMVDSYSSKYGISTSSVHKVGSANWIVFLIVLGLAGYVIYKFLN